MAAVMLQVIPSFYTNYSKHSLIISTNIYQKNIVIKKYCIASHDDKMCFLPNCSYHFVLIGDIKELLQELDVFCFNYQLVVCLYTLLKYRFSSKTVVESGQLFASVLRAVQFNHQNRGVDRMPSIAKKKLLRKKYKKQLLSSFQKTNTTQTSTSVFVDRIEQVRKIEIELEVIKLVAYFLDVHGKFTSNLVSFKIKSL